MKHDDVKRKLLANPKVREAYENLEFVPRELMGLATDIVYFWETDNEGHPDREAAMQRLADLLEQRDERSEQ